MSEQAFTVDGMHCDKCAGNIEAGLIRLDAVRQVSADATTRLVHVRFDDRRLSADDIAAHLERLGFTASASEAP
ncbi:copper chaperone [Nocardiopsis gilva YIM 90087]|uniref:Copper chaperone n=1 Tax=Nocardiopsis gilva YIM 90087 TaxID=1235441 RepID=A0A223S832_9ACTN|nr:heavy-metal-associated domain-containing protein [Nocardiopsis gilva]ASU84266.1 copper chaperone [Nocardiopsis gilva YIM 90087]